MQLCRTASMGHEPSLESESNERRELVERWQHDDGIGLGAQHNDFFFSKGGHMGSISIRFIFYSSPELNIHQPSLILQIFANSFTEAWDDKLKQMCLST